VNWIKGAAKRLTGGDKIAFEDEIRSLFEGGNSVDFGEIAASHSVSLPTAQDIVRSVGADFLFKIWDSRLDSGSAILADAEADGVQFSLGPQSAKEIAARYARHKIEPVVVDMLADNVVDPPEDARLSSLLVRLGVQLDANSQSAISEAKMLWAVSNDPLPIASSPLLLKRGETCHHVVVAEASEDRTKTVRVNYGGASARVKIMKGVYYRVGSTNIQRVTEEYAHSFGSGALCFTNQRLLWTSPQKTIAIPISRIINYETYSDGIKIYKDSGKPMTFAWNAPDRVATVLAVRVIEECR
jgi:hypothetical protein